MVEYAISGSEYGGLPDPLVGIDLELPKSMRVRQSLLPTCPQADLEWNGPGPAACARGSAAGPPGQVLMELASGKALVPEEAPASRSPRFSSMSGPARVSAL